MYKKMILDMIKQNVIGFCWQKGKKNMGIENINILTTNLKNTDYIRFKVTLNNAFFNDIFNEVEIFGRVCTHAIVIDTIVYNGKKICRYLDNENFNNFDFSNL